MSCSALASQDFTTIADAPTSLTSETLVGTGASQYCDVTGFIAPETQFELRLPTTTYQGRYLQTGCGGNCGVVSIGISPATDTAMALTSNTFAVSTNDEGHPSTGMWDVWGAGGASNPLRAQFGYRADHLNAVVAKRIIETFYGQPPAYSYFDGYSDGGRAAIQEAQRYPNDFNGIVAGAPAIDIQDALTSFVWAADKMLNPDGSPIFTSAAITTLHNGAIAACDGLDGADDGQIGDPQLCHWDPKSIECKATLTSNCLTPQQVAAAEAMYEGPQTKTGQRTWPGGQAYGSELAWPGFAAAGVALGTDNLRYLAFAKDPPANYTYRDFEFTKSDWQALQPMAAVYDSDNSNHPNLNAFNRHGGKLLVWQSWQDEAAGPYSTEDWYAQVAQRAGGIRKAKAFARFFTLPAGSHGQTAGAQIYQLNVLPELINWTETGDAPNEIVAWQTDSSGNVTRTYPSYAMPEVPRYKGSGNVDEASSWVPYAPVTNMHYEWLGDPHAAPVPYPGFPFAQPPATSAHERHTHRRSRLK